MIRGGFLSAEDRRHLIALARDGSAAARLTRRANALVLLDDGWTCQEVAAAFLLNDDTIRGWHKLFEQRGIEGLTSADVGGRSFLSAVQQGALMGRVPHRAACNAHRERTNPSLAAFTHHCRLCRRGRKPQCSRSTGRMLPRNNDFMACHVRRLGCLRIAFEIRG
jgi:hypothetical protein